MRPTWIILFVALLVSACGSTSERFDAEVDVPVSVEDIGMKPIEEFVVTTGTVNATKDETIKSETSGYYRLALNPRTSRPFALGDLVKKNEDIIYLDNPEQENTIRIESQKLSLDTSQREYEKQQSLYEKGGVTLRELKDSERSYIDAKYSYDNAVIQLSKMKITSTFDGVIVDLPYYTPGVKTASGTEMVHVMNYGILNMEITLPGNLMGKVKGGQQVRIMNYTIPDKIFPGSLTQLSPVLDSDTRTFKAMVDIDNQNLMLRPGMFVKAEIVTARKDSTVVIPKNIIISRRNRKSVFVVERGIASERTIDTGLENPDNAEVIKGLNVNERLVIEGFETLRNGSKVKIKQ